MRPSHCIAVLAVAAAAPASHALTIDLNDTGATPMAAHQLAAFEQAAAIWENAFGDPITVKVNIEFANLNPNVLGSTLTQRTTHSLGAVRAAMHADTFGTEQGVVSQLPTGSLPVQDINGSRNTGSVTLATANAKALGLGTGLDPVYGAPLPGGADGRIQFANAFASSFDYDRSDGITAGQTDFVGVAAHEIGHLLGFFSVTDVQDNNAGFTLQPNTLDLWRFEETGGGHVLASGTRRITHGPAEYYDTVLNNRQMSRGVHPAEPIDPLANSSTGKAQASHWRDNLDNMMDPTIAAGVQVVLRPDDRHAIDYIGYNRRLLFIPYIPREILIGWFPWLPDPPPFLPDFNGAFEAFAPPPDPKDVQPPFEPDFAMRLGLNFGIEGFEKRSGLGFVRFAPEQFNQYPVIEGVPAERGEGTLEPDRERAETLPPSLLDFYFESDHEGVPFRARAMLADSGAEFDPSLGKFGGYRVPIAIDGLRAPNSPMDATATLVLLADEAGVPDPERMNLFSLAPEVGDNFMHVLNPEALGLKANLLGDMNLDGAVDAVDVAPFVLALTNPAAYVEQYGMDPHLIGDINQSDGLDAVDVAPFVALLVDEKGAFVPEPGSLGLLGVALLMVPARRRQRAGLQ
ncbi:MAG: NF038122 family metalloprotease [Phycisphaeraceae bacterium]